MSSARCIDFPLNRKRSEIIMKKIKDNRVTVRYKFKNSDEVHVVLVTWNQFENLKEINIIEYCELIN